MSGVANSVATPGQGVRVSQQVNDFSKKSVVEIILTADNDAGTAALSTISLIPGIGKGAVSTLPAGVTVSGDYTTWADWIAYAQSVGMYIDKIWMQSDDTDNFNNKITWGLIMPNGSTPNETYRQLQGYKESTGNGFADNITIENIPLVVIPPLYTKVQLKKNTYLRIQLYIPEMTVSASTTGVAY